MFLYLLHPLTDAVNNQILKSNYFAHSIIQAPVVKPAPKALNTNLSPF
jgi:hypothetical protein